MTTNVIDLAVGISVTDSRWSYQAPFFTLYVDDVGFEKIVEYRQRAYTFAGDGELIQVWKDWLASEPTSVHSMPDVERETPQGVRSVTICIVKMATKEVSYRRGTAIAYDQALFAGTGGFAARLCWDKNRDAKKAVESAIQKDLFSGGTVKYLVFADNDNNLSEFATIGEVNRQLATRGVCMIHAAGNATNTGTPVSGSDHEKEIAKIKEQLTSGDIVASAPCDAMFERWSEEEKEQLRTALQDALFD